MKSLGGSLLGVRFLFFYLAILFPCCSFSSSLEPDVFSESAFWSPTLNSLDRRLGYDDATVDSWHLENAPKLKRIYDVYNRQNVALARLTFVFQGVDGIWKDAKVELNKAFFSGWPLPSHSSGQDAKFFVQRILGDGYSAYALKEYYSECHPAEEWPDIDYFNHLKSIFDFTKDGEEYETLPDEMKTRFSSVHSLLESGSKLDELKSRFYDTEPLVFLHCDNEMFSREALGTVRGKIAHIIVDIASYKDMCFDCRDVGFIQSKFLRGFSKEITESLRKTRAFTGGIISFDGYSPKFIIRVSSQEETTMHGNRRMTTRKDRSYAMLSTAGKDGNPLNQLISADRIFIDSLSGYVVQLHF